MDSRLYLQLLVNIPSIKHTPAIAKTYIHYTQHAQTGIDEPEGLHDMSEKSGSS